MNDLLSLPRMARHLGVTQQWLKEQAQAGRVPALRAGSRYLFNPETVLQVLADEAKKGGAK